MLCLCCSNEYTVANLTRLPFDNLGHTHTGGFNWFINLNRYSAASSTLDVRCWKLDVRRSIFYLKFQKSGSNIQLTIFDRQFRLVRVRH